jgi:hypothetical protein
LIHTSSFLHAGDVSRISVKAQTQIENTDLVISPMVLLELEMLYDKRTIKYPSSQILADVTQQIRPVSVPNTVSRRSFGAPSRSSGPANPATL